MLNKITQGDSIEEMRKLADNSVDLIIIDPPYNIGKDKRWDKWKTVDSYVEFMTEIFQESERVLKPTGSFYWFHNDMEQIARLMQTLGSETSFVYKQMITWNKRFDTARNKGFLDGFVEVGGLRNYQKMAEYCLFYTFQDDTGLSQVMLDVNNFSTLRNYFRDFQNALGLSLPQINRKLCHRKAEHAFYWKSTQWDLPTKETYEEISKLPRSESLEYREYESLRVEYEDLRMQYEELRYTYNNQKTHHSVWNYEIAPKQGHITPKPVEIIENIILHSSNEDDVVLDCFLGSGTTAVAAINTGRQFIGIERETEYCEIARQRITDALQTEVNG